MQLVPLIGEQPVQADAFSIVVSQTDLSRVAFLISRTAIVKTVSDKQSFEQASDFAGKLKNMLQEIHDAKRAAKRPFEAVEQAIDNKAEQVAESLQAEDKRIRGLLNAYAAKVEAEQKAEQKAREDALRLEKARLEKIAAEARAAQLKAEADARAAKDEAEEIRARLHAKQLADAVLNAELDKALAAELSDLGANKDKLRVPGGRIDHPWKFRLLDVEALVRAGFKRCLRYEIDVLACRDEIRAQLERNKNGTPHIPGIEITREPSISVRASA